MKSSILIFDHPNPSDIHLGADFLSSKDALPAHFLSGRRVLVLNTKKQNLKDIFKNFPKNAGAPKDLQLILIGQDLDLSDFREAAQWGSVYSWKTDFSPELNSDIEQAISFQSDPYIEKQIDALAASEHEKLQSRSIELEEIVEKREKNLERAQKRIMTINRQMESLLSALQAVHKANSVGEVESLLLRSLEKELQLSFVRVFFSDNLPMQQQLERHPEIKTLKVPLNLGSKSLGLMMFGRMQTKFTKPEKEFLAQVAEGVSLAIDRLTKLEQTEHLKHQWDSTFDSISEPLCLTDTSFKIIKTNRAFIEAANLKTENFYGTNCFQAFVGKGSAPQLVAGGSLMIERRIGDSGEVKTFSVSAQKIQAKKTGEPILLVLFRDISQQRRIERQIFESAKMAELGTVGSSIAHELNNPLGGMISFLQLIKMDLEENNPIRPDILEMEKAGQRCKEIIENLLGFSRRGDGQNEQAFDIREAIQQSLRLIEIKSKSAGVEITHKLPDETVMVSGFPQMMVQAISHIFQNAFDAIQQKATEQGRFRGKIDLVLSQKKNKVFLTIKDNGVGIDPGLQNRILNPLFSTKGRSNSGLGLSLAFKIVDEHHGRLEVFSQPNSGTEVKISLNNV